MPKTSVIAFHAGRRILVVDGAHMRSGYHMRMLLAVAYDARGQMYIVAVALVSGEESSDNVTWFLNNVKCGGITTPSVIVSDRGAALLASVPAVYPGMCIL
jgi:hypothetical protein